MYNMRQFFFALTLACRLLYIIFRFYKPLLPCTTLYSMIVLFASKSWPISRKKEKESYFVHFRNSNVWQMVWKTVSYNVWSKFILRIPEVNCLADVAEPNLVGTCSGLLKISRLELVNFFFFFVIRFGSYNHSASSVVCGRSSVTVRKMICMRVEDLQKLEDSEHDIRQS